LLVTSMEVPSSVVPVWRLEIKAGPIWAFTRPIGPSGLGRPRLKPGAGVHRCGWSCPCRRRWEVAVLRQVWRWSGCVSISSVWCRRTMALRLQRWVLRWQRCESTRRCCPNPSRCGTGDDLDESPAWQLSSRRRRRLWVSDPSVEASPRCVTIFLTPLELVGAYE
jgi:hypothetical protein